MNTTYELAAKVSHRVAAWQERNFGTGPVARSEVIALIDKELKKKSNNELSYYREILKNG